MAVHPGSIWLDSHWTQLPTGFWVAADSNGIVAEDTDLVKVYAALVKLNVTVGQVTIAFIPAGVLQ